LTLSIPALKRRAKFRPTLRVENGTYCGLILEFSYNAKMNIELRGLSEEQIANLLPEGLISLCWRGSVAHGMYVPKSDPDSIDDKDVMGVYVAPIEHYLGFGRQDVFEKWEGEWDCVFYELRKFIGLLLNCNPNVLSLLWLKENGIIYESSLGRLLRDHRDLFVTKRGLSLFLRIRSRSIQENDFL
jgi:RNA repair pathway DNA polymerase beta family